MPKPFRRPLAVATWSLVALLASGCSLFREPVAAPVPTPPAATPTPVDVEALIVERAAEQTGYPESLIRAFLAARGIDLEQIVADLGIPADQVDDIIADMEAQGVDTVEELQVYLSQLQTPATP